MPAAQKKDSLQVTTVRLPKGLYSEATRIVKEDEEIGSFNDFVVESLREQIRQRREARLDAAFCDMGTDVQYQRESKRVNDEFAMSDWETLKHSK